LDREILGQAIVLFRLLPSKLKQRMRFLHHTHLPNLNAANIKFLCIQATILQVEKFRFQNLHTQMTTYYRRQLAEISAQNKSALAAKRKTKFVKFSHLEPPINIFNYQGVQSL
jgi:hypothetical protein